MTAELWVGVARHVGVAKDSEDRLIEARAIEVEDTRREECARLIGAGKKVVVS